MRLKKAILAITAFSLLGIIAAPCLAQNRQELSNFIKAAFSQESRIGYFSALGRQTIPPKAATYLATQGQSDKQLSIPPSGRIAKWPADKIIRVAFNADFGGPADEEEKVKKAFFGIKQTLQQQTGLKFQWVKSPLGAHDNVGQFEKADISIVHETWSEDPIINRATKDTPYYRVLEAGRNAQETLLLDKNGNIEKARCSYRHGFDEKECFIRSLGLINAQVPFESAGTLLPLLYSKNIRSGMPPEEALNALR